MATIRVDGAELSFHCAGAGPTTLAFVHGWCSKAAHWDAQVGPFAARRQVLRWDRRGMGRSTAGAASAAAPATAQRHADDLAALLDHLGVDEAVVVGHAGGGPSALTFAVNYPDRTQALILVDTRLHAVPTGGQPDGWAAALEGSIAQISGPGGDEHLRAMYAGFFGPRADPAVVADAVANALATPREVAAGEIRHMVADTAELARQVRCPVLWVSAQPQDSEFTQAAFADVTIGHVVGSGHFVQLEVPDQLNPMIEAFLTDRGL